MSFIIKNISSHPVNVLGTNVNPNTRLDLLTIASGAQIIASLRNGSLYELFQGRKLAVTALEGFQNIGATQADLDYFSYCGFMQGHLNEDDLKYPFQFTTDGYLQTTASIGSVTVEVQSEIEGRVADGASAAGVNPVIIGGVDSSGNAQSAAISTDGYLLANINASTELTAEIEGRVLDGASAAGIKPVIIAGVDANGNAQNITTTTDGYIVTTSAGIAFDDGYTTVRTLSATTADTEPPLSASFVTLTGHTPGAFVEFMFNITALAGTVTADAVTFKIWRQLSNGYIDSKVDEFTVNATDVINSASTQLTRKILPISASKVYVTVTFVGGTSPNITGQIYARPISAGAGGVQKADLSFDKSKNLNVVPPSYDGAANADRTIALNDVSDKWTYEIPVDLTGTGIATANYDIDMRGYSSCTFHISATSGTTSSLKFRFESIADINSASPLNVPITVSGFNVATNSFLGPDYATQDVTVGTTNTKYRIDYGDLGSVILRVVVTASSHASNVLKIVVAKKF